MSSNSARELRAAHKHFGALSRLEWSPQKFTANSPIVIPRRKSTGMDFRVTNLSSEDSSVSPKLISRQYRKIIHIFLGLLCVYAVIRGIVEAATKQFSFDEVITLVVASQSGHRGIWDALASAVDGQPPTFYAMERLALSLVSNIHVALRLLSVLAIPCIMICLFLYVRRRGSELAALLAAILVLSSSIFHEFATNARPYSMVMACLALALVCHQRLPSPRWALLFGISLSLAESLHYFAILAVVPFIVAEAVLCLKLRQFRWLVWIALVFAFLPLWICWPLLASVKSYYGAHAWMHFGFVSIPKAYGGFFLTDSAFGMAIATFSFLQVVATRIWPKYLPSETEGRAQPDLVEGTLILSLISLPFIGFVAMKVMHGVLLDRYVLATAIGICLAIAYSMSLVRPFVAVAGVLCVLTSFTIHELSFWRSNGTIHFAPRDPGIEEFVQTAGHPDLPVVISSGLTYVPLEYYTSPQWKDKFIFLADPEKSVQYVGTDSVDKGVLVLQRFMPLRVSNYTDFIRSQQTFLLYAEDPSPAFDWVTTSLVREVTSVRVLKMDKYRRLYLVSMK